MLQPTTGNVTPFPPAATTANLGFDPSQPPTISAGSIDPIASASQRDEYSIKKTDEKPEKRGPIRLIKDFVRTAKKFGNSLFGYAKATFVGIGAGILAGVATFAGSSGINKIKDIKHSGLIKKNAKIAEKNIAIAADNAARIAKDAAAELIQQIPQLPVKKLRKLPAKPLAIAVGVGALIAKLWNASLNINDQNAHVDLRWKHTPVVDKNKK